MPGNECLLLALDITQEPEKVRELPYAMLRGYHSSAQTDRVPSGHGWTIVGLALASWILVLAVLFSFQVLARTILG